MTEPIPPTQGMDSAIHADVATRLPYPKAQARGFASLPFDRFAIFSLAGKALLLYYICLHSIFSSIYLLEAKRIGIPGYLGVC